jgi:putative ABC transport system permease protein
MLRATLTGMLAHKLRLFLTATSITLGVAFLAGTLMLTDSMQRAFDDVFDETTTGADVVVHGESDFGGVTRPVPADLINRVQDVDGVDLAAGEVSGYAVITDADGEAILPKGAPTAGTSLPADKDLLGEITLRSGRLPERAGEVVIDAGSARKGDLSVGSTTRILFQGPAEEFTVVGTVGFGDEDDLAGSTSAFFDLQTAQRVLGKDGSYDRINVTAAGGVTAEDLAERVDAVLPNGTEAVTGAAMADESSAEVMEDLGFLRIALLVFAGIALFVGSFIIWNTFSMQVAQRTRELALFRAIGATRRQVMRTILLEAVLIGAASSAVGIGIGVGMARGLSSLMSAFGLELPTAAPRIQLSTVVISLLVGTLVTLVASIAPSRRATKVLPVEALRDSAPGAQRFSRSRLAIGLAVTALGATTALAALFGGAPIMLLAVGVVGLILGVTTLAPLVVGPMAAWIGAPLKARGVPGTLARQNAMRNPRRTASTAMALVIGLTMVTAVTVLAASLKASFHDIVGSSAKADLYVAASSDQAPGFSPEVTAAVHEVPGVKTVSATGFGELKVNGEVERFSSIDPRTADDIFDLGMPKGGADDLSDGGLLVYDKTAQENGWSVGDVLPVAFPGGKTELTVDGIFSTKGYLNGNFLVSLGTQDRFEPDRLDTTAMVLVEDGAGVTTVKDRIDAALDDMPDARVMGQQEFESATVGFIDQLVNLITILLLLAVVIALLGIVNTLALSVFERTRELGLLRAVGMTQGQVRAMVRGESVVISVIGALLGAVLGIGLGAALTRALYDQGIEIISIPGLQLGLYVVAAAAAGVLAAIGPARSAARVDVLKAVVTD